MRISINPKSARIWGRNLASGTSPEAAAEQFCFKHMAAFGVEPRDLHPAQFPGNDRHTTPVMFDPLTGHYRFTAVYYQQVHHGIPVYGARLIVLVRNEPGYPVVLVNPDLRPLGDFQPDAGRADRPLSRRTKQRIRQRFALLSGEPPAAAQVVNQGRVIWAGGFGENINPVLADRMVVQGNEDRWLFLTDAATGEILRQECRILSDRGSTQEVPGGPVSGTVIGLATTGIASAECEDEAWTTLPHVPVESGGRRTYTNAGGDFTLPGSLSSVQSSLHGIWFEVFNLDGPDLVVSASSSPLLQLGFNAVNTEPELAQINAYVEANRARDFALQFNPSYPMLDRGGMPVNVNASILGCPGNAFYFPDEGAMYFCLGAGAIPNTAWSSIVHHEYGHHLIEMAGSGQGAYGEGMSDSLAQIISDDPRLAVGFPGDCTGFLRTGDNNHQFPCFGEIHDCGQLLSGCLWSTRNALAVTHPDYYREILSTLTINSILLHTGASIDPGIAIDFLTLDDDDGDILNGTPHSAEIIAGFNAHGMIAPLSIDLPGGIPEFISPEGSQSMVVRIRPGVNDSLIPDSPRLHFRHDGGVFAEIPLTNLGNDLFEADLPASPCGSAPEYYFSAVNDQGLTILIPADAPGSIYTAIVGVPRQVFADNFEADQGWTTADTGATSGFWQRGMPIDDPDWEFDPVTDGDGSGQCWLTQNEPGNTDVDDGRVLLISPTLDLSTGEYLISYDYFLRLNEPAAADSLSVRISSFGDAGPWIKVVSHVHDGGLAWRHHAITQADLDFRGVIMTANMKVRFGAFDGSIPSIVEAGVDGFRVVEVQCPAAAPCPADCAPLGGDGIVDGADILALLNDFGGPGTPCDVNGNGTVNIDDLVAMLNAFGACP